MVEVELASQRLEALNAEELELLRKLASGSYDREIARELHVSQRTVKRRVADLLDKLGLERRIQAAYVAGEVGLLNGDLRRE